MENQRKGRRLVFFPMPFQGHINPMLQLANILYSQGFSITIIHTHFNSPDKSNYPHFTFQPLPVPEGLFEQDGSRIEFDDVVYLIQYLNINCVQPFRDCLVRLLSDAAAEPIPCLITDAIFHFTQAVADNLKLPRIVLRTSSISSFLVFNAIPLLIQKGYLSMKDSQSEDLVSEAPPLRVKDVPIMLTHKAEVLSVEIATVIKAMKASSGIIWNSFEELEQPAALGILRQNFPIPSFPIGPFHMRFPASSSSLFTQDQSSISWLDLKEPKSVIYVSFGSIATIDKTEFLEMAWALANSMHPFLWVIRPGVIGGSEWLEPLPSGFLEKVGERGHIVKWAPQQEVLAHPATGCFWSHGGWNSTLESICEGVPMMCSPSFGDQPVNARYIDVVWKIGLQLEKGVNRQEIESAIRRLMVDQEGKEMRDRIMCLKEKVNICLKQDGSSSQSLKSLASYILTL